MKNEEIVRKKLKPTIDITFWPTRDQCDYADFEFMVSPLIDDLIKFINE